MVQAFEGSASMRSAAIQFQHLPNLSGRLDLPAKIIDQIAHLKPEHIDHLLDEGFSLEDITRWVKKGLRSLTEKEAFEAGFKVKTKNGYKSSAGLYFPFTDNFGQVRCDKPLERPSGDQAKYLTPLGTRTQARIPEGCKVITEGAKDGCAGSIHGGIPTGVVAGVSHVRKACKEGAGYTLLFDNDGWSNPNIIRSLIQGGLHLNGKIQLVPDVPGEPKAGLCEWFKFLHKQADAQGIDAAEYKRQEYAKLIKAALKPDRFLMEWGKRFKDVPDHKTGEAVGVALRFATQLLDCHNAEILIQSIKKAKLLSIKDLRSQLDREKAKLREKQKQGETVQPEKNTAQELNVWTAPISCNGEIGTLEQIPSGDGEKIEIFTPLCNFDFKIATELTSEDGGALVLNVKRSLDNETKQVLIKSLDYGNASDFEAALKKALGSGVVCKLSSDDLKSLIHRRLQDYRTKGGKTYKLIDRIGQQEDGHWVFSNCQISKDGIYSEVPNSDWVFNPNLGGEEKLPIPEIAPPDPSALKRLVAAMQKFHGNEGIFPAMMSLGFVAAGVHYQTIMKREKRFPQINFIGDAGSNKSVCASNGLSLIGWLGNNGMVSGVSESRLYEALKLCGSLPICLDDPQRSREVDELLKRLYNGVARQVRQNYQEPHSPLMATSNHAIGDDQLATLSRMLQVPVYRVKGGNPNAWDEMQDAMKKASGALPDLIKLGYPAEQIRALESDLRKYLPRAHPRIASSMSLILWYAMAVAKLADFDAESIKRYAVEQLCPIANAADSNADSISDFLDKLSALKSEALAGEWNVRTVATGEKKYLAIYLTEVWKELDKHFHPIYSRKVLEALIAREGGKLQSTQQFHRNKDESLTYYRLRLNPPDGKLQDINPPAMITKRCVLLPYDLVRKFIGNWETPEDTPEDTESHFSSHGSHQITSESQKNVIAEAHTEQTLQPLVTDRSHFFEREHTNLQPTKKIEDEPAEAQFIESLLEPLSSDEDLRSQANHDLLLEKNVIQVESEAESYSQQALQRSHFSCDSHVIECDRDVINVIDESVAQADAIASASPVQNAPRTTKLTAAPETPQPPQQDAVERKNPLSCMEARCKGEIEAALWFDSAQQKVRALTGIRREYERVTYENAITALTPDEQQQIEGLRRQMQ